MWNKTTFDGGVVKPYATIHARFVFSGNIAEVLTFTLSCGCSSGNWDAVLQVLTVKVDVGAIPVHLKEYVVSKFATVKYSVLGEQKTDVLIINGLVK